MQAAENRDYGIKTLNNWMRESKKRPIPRALFGEFWLEGETAVLFGDTGKGKSALAMQIAESIASGKRIEPFEANAEPQKVLYLDLEMNDKQLEMRHAADHEGGRARFLHKHYIFSDNLFRTEYDPADALTLDGRKPCDVFCRDLRCMVEETKARVVIIDSITCLKRTYYGVRETLELMKVLKRLRKELNLSILVLVQTSKRGDSAAVTANNLQGLKILCGLADNIFGIGQSRFEAAGRYIKRVRTLSDTMVYDAMHVPAFRLKKIGGNFLGFEFERFAPEIELIQDIRDQQEWETIERIKQLTDDGMSIRETAAAINLPKTTVHRLLQMWRPPVEDEEIEALVDANFYLSGKGRRYPYFPGCEEYYDALEVPRFEGMYERDDEQSHLLRRLYYVIEAARARARKMHEKTGVCPPLDSNSEYVELINALNGDGRVQNNLSRENTAVSDNEAGANEIIIEEDPAEISNENFAGDRETSFSGLVRSTDAYGDEIFIEKMGPNGKPDIWYKTDRQGNKMRHERKDGIGVFISVADPGS